MGNSITHFFFPNQLFQGDLNLYGKIDFKITLLVDDNKFVGMFTDGLLFWG